MIATVTAVTANGTSGNNNEFYNFIYTMSDGVSLGARHKKAEPFPEGSEVEYEIRGSNSYGNYGAVKKPSAYNNGTTPYKSNGSTSVPNGNKDRIIARQSSLKVALDYLHQKGFQNQDQVSQLQELTYVAEFITDYVLSDSDGTPAPKNRPDYQGKGEIPRHPQAPVYDGSQEADLAREQATAHLADDLPF